MKLYNNYTKGIKRIFSGSNRLKMCPGLIFFLALIVISLLYYYHIIILSPPQSIHRWRQTDCTSITLNYYQHGMKFFRPEVHSLVSDGYTTGYAAGEAPVLYYFIAALYRVTGPDDTVYRIANTLVFYIGLFALFKISSFFLQDKFLAAFIPLLIFTSPVAAYYGCNYLPDTAALTFVFLGWLQFLKYYSGNQYWKYLLSVVFFGLAGLLKISMSINLVALTGFIFLHHIKTMQLPGNLTLRNALKKYLPLITGGCIITGWYLYAVRYNDYHDATTFLTGTRPWWDLAADERQDITRFIMDNNLSLYFSHAVLYFLAACLILTVAWFKKIQKLLVIITGLLLTGGLIFVNFWYSQFQYHDYYFITLFAPLAFLIITAMTGLRTCCEKILQSWWFRVALIAFLIFNVFHARHEIKLRYFGWKREAPVYEEYFTIRPHLGSMGIRPNDRVISIPDVTSCYTLYMMNQPGNNLPGINRSTAGDIKKFIGLGARYLFVNDTALVNDPILQEFLKVRIGNVKNVHIFRLDSLDSFNLKP